jgi:hypothetical protein
MSITRQNPNTIFLGGDRTQVNDLAASAAITPGHLIERTNNAGVIRWRKHATAGGDTAPAIATDQSMLNKSVDDDYAANDLVEASILHAGATAWMLIASGQDIAAGQKLESAGNGTLRALASGTALFTALENKPTVTVLTRIRVEAIK